ncbi:MAG: DUF58 domain-containing protein, partial [Chloroflexota bacterium]
MRFNIFNRASKESTIPLFDEAFLRRLERLTYRSAPALRGKPLGERRSRKLRPAVDFSDHRPYTPGDDLRHIDWYAYSRHGDLVVKLGEATQSVDVHVLLDDSRSMVWQPDSSQKDRLTKWDMARRLTGALAYMGLAGGETVYLSTTLPQSATDGPLTPHALGPLRGKQQVMPALQYLSALSPLTQDKSDPHSLGESLVTYARQYPKGGILVLVSDLLDTIATEDAMDQGQFDNSEHLAEGLRFLTPPLWQIIVLHLLTEEEMQPTLTGDFDLKD